MTDSEYVAKLVAATRVSHPKRVEIHFKTELSIIVEAKDQLSTEAAESTALDQNPETKDLINWIRQYRIEKGISIDALASQIGIAKGSLMAYLDGRRTPSQTRLGRIAKFKESAKVEKP